MNISKNLIISALVFPVVALGIFTAFKKYKIEVGTKIVLPISGYDPRDLLSGHYLVYTVEYGATPDCDMGSQPEPSYYCIDAKRFYRFKPSTCSAIIRGRCQYNRFLADIEKFYIPEDKASELDKLVRGKEAAIEISVQFDGTAQVRDLLINGKSWRELY